LPGWRRGQPPRSPAPALTPVRACARACERARLVERTHVCPFVYLHICARARVYARARECVRACVYVHMRECARRCMRVRACIGPAVSANSPHRLGDIRRRWLGVPTQRTAEARRRRTAARSWCGAWAVGRGRQQGVAGLWLLTAGQGGGVVG
jgi:hypothetical protein